MKVLVRAGASWKATDAYTYGNEVELQELLRSMPGVLSATQFGGPEFVVAIREFGLPGSGSTDLVGVSARGDVLVAECKLARNDEIKRKVIGQILEYGAYLWKMSYTDFDERFRRGTGRSLIDLVKDELARRGELPQDWRDDAFAEALEANLDRGDFTLAIVVDNLNDDLARTLSYMNERGRSSRFSALCSPTSDLQGRRSPGRCAAAARRNSRNSRSQGARAALAYRERRSL